MNASRCERAALDSLLRWYAAMGVDAAVDEMPHDRLTEAGPPTPPPSSLQRSAIQRGPIPTARTERPSTPQFTAPSAPADDLVREAEGRAAAAQDLATLQEAFTAQPGLSLATSARMIFAGGTPGARFMIFGAQPESDDERQGEAFAGQHGRLLDAMLRAAGLDRGGVYFAHVVPWRPPGNRWPSALELSLCLPYTRRHIALAAPDIILCLGERAAQPLLNSTEPITRLRGRWHAYEGEATTTKLLATFSPSYLLSQPLHKRRAWSDLQMMMAERHKS